MMRWRTSTEGRSRVLRDDIVAKKQKYQAHKIAISRLVTPPPPPRDTP